MNCPKPYNPLNGGRYAPNKTQNPINKTVTTEEIAWLSGIWEGEGSWYFSKPRIIKQKTKGYIPYKCNGCIRMTLNMTDQDVMERVSKIMDNRKCTFSHPPSKKDKGRKPSWFINLQGSAAILWTDRMMPYLGNRRREKYLNLIHEIYGIEYCSTFKKVNIDVISNPLIDLFEN